MYYAQEQHNIKKSTEIKKKKWFWPKVIPVNNIIIILIFALSLLKRNLCLVYLKYNSRYVFTNKRGGNILSKIWFMVH